MFIGADIPTAVGAYCKMPTSCFPEATSPPPPGTMLPHLKGARPTIHAGLLRPVLRSRTKTGGHPGAPPPNRPRKRKLNKRRNQHAQDESTPQTNTPCEQLQHDVRDRMRRKRRERNPAEANGGNTSHTGQGGSGSDESRHAMIRPSCLVHPSSASCAHARFMSSDLIRAEAGGGAGRGIHPVDCAASRAERGVAHKEPASQKSRADGSCFIPKNITGAQYQADLGEEPPVFRSAASGNKRRPSLLRFRPATRQELNHSNSLQHAATGTGTPVTGKFGAGKLNRLRFLEVAHQPRASRGRRKPRRGAGSHDRYAEDPSPLSCHPKVRGGDLDGKETSRLPAVAAAPDQYNTGEPKPVVDNSGTFGAEEGGGCHDETKKSTQDAPAAQQRCSNSLTGCNHDNNTEDNGDDNAGNIDDADDNNGALATGYGGVPSCCSPTTTTLYHVASCTCELCRRERSRRIPGPPARPTFKFVGVEPRLVSATLQAHQFTRHTGARAARGGARATWRLLWSSQHLRSHVFRNLKRGQRINSFPRTYECTRKDALSRNMNRMSQVHGARHFGFVPRGFVLPAEREGVREAMQDTSEGEAWIVKPASSACGRGIYITKNFSDLPLGTGPEGNWIAQRYVDNPLLLDGLKFDLRLYVAVTCFRPLRVYMHEEGLCRLATEPYRNDAQSLGNRFIHLTNYSINRKSSRYEPGTTSRGDEDESAEDIPENNPDSSGAAARPPECSPERSDAAMPGGVFSTPSHVPARSAISGETGTGGGVVGSVAASAESAAAEDSRADKRKGTTSRTGGSAPANGTTRGGGGGGTGSKWSLKALRRRLVEMGVDVPALWGNIHDLCIKTLIAIEAQVSAAVELLAIRRGTCFEMFGFDVLVDQHQRPHLLEVNFAPSLNTDSDLDLEVKSKVVADLLTLAGIRGSPGFQRPPSQGANANDHATGVDGGDGGGRNKDGNAQRSVGKTSVADAGDAPLAPPRCKTTMEGKVSGRASRKGGRRGEEGLWPGTEGGSGVDFGDQAGRPKTKGGDRLRPISRPRSRQGNAGDRSGGDGDRVGGDRAAPAWEGSFRGGDGASPSADEMAAVAADSESELRRSGGFELIFPVAGTANKYLKFFDGPRPLERMLANSALARDKAAPAGPRDWRGVVEKSGSRRGDSKSCRQQNQDSKDHRRASSVSPIRDLKAM